MDTNSHGGEEYSKSMNENYGYTGNYCSYEQEHEHEHGQN